MDRRPALLALAVLAAAVPAGAAVSGRVAASSGLPVEGARVEVVESGEHTTTDARGRFAFPGAEPPVTLLVTQTRFVEQAVTVTAETGPVEVTLTPKQQVYEEIIVAAVHEGDAFAPAAIASTVVDPAERLAPPSTLLEAVEGTPGVAENGQAGLFQVVSIRGVSRHRVLTLIDGMQITSERRAGVSASFLDPLLMGSIDLLRGPASSYYGSGALGGVVQVFPASFETLRVETAYDSQGDERVQAVGWGRGGEDGFSLGIAHRRAGNAEDPEGGEINSHFEQTSLSFAKRWGGERRSWELKVLPTLGRDLGKANTDFPERTTDYPEENHLLVKLAGRTAGRLRFHAWAHPHELVTDTRESDGQRSTVFNQTLDFGANAQKELSLRGAWEGRAGLDYFGRRGVDAEEEELLPGTSEPTRATTLDGGEQDEAAVYASVRRPLGRATVEAGGRWTWLRQANAGEPSLSRNAGSGFLSAVVPLGSGFELAANAGTGLRFPNLSERFFTGTTGRGEIVSNRDLEPERSFNTDLRLAWYGRRLFVEADVFRNRIDDYIERVEVEPDVLTFVNLTSGTLTGFETEAFFQIDERWRLSWGGHTIDGEDDAGGPLADVPADRAFLGLRQEAGESGRWSWGARVERRFSHDDPGSGEKEIPAATLLSAQVGVRLASGLEVRLTGANLLDEAYFNSADRKTPLAPGRSLGVGLSWRR